MNKSIFRPNILALKPYSSARSEYQGQAICYLDANENPYENRVNRYPDPLQMELRTIVSQIKKTDASNLFIGNGSDEAIDLLIRATCNPGVDEIIVTDPSYGMYSVSAAINQVKVKKVPLNIDFNLNSNEILKNVDDNTKLILLCSPNNPTGNELERKEILHIINNFQGLVIVDEAYIEFSSQPSLLSELSKYPNLVILQTLSKAYGMAGLRIGFAFASNIIIDVLNSIKPPYNVSVVAQDMAVQLLRSQSENLTKQVKEIINERKKLTDFLVLNEHVIKVFPSDANFILVRFKQSEIIFNYLTKMGIIVRNRSKELNCEGCLRFTVGTPAENMQLMNALLKYN